MFKREHFAFLTRSVALNYKQITKKLICDKEAPNECTWILTTNI